MPPCDGCSPPEAFRFAPSFPLRFACGLLPLTCPRVGTGPGGDSRPHLRHCNNKIAVLLIISGIAIIFVIENYSLVFGRQMEKRLVENIAHLWLLQIFLESTLQWSGCAAMRHAVASERRGHPRPRGGGRVRRRQVPRQRDAGNGGRGDHF